MNARRPAGAAHLESYLQALEGSSTPGIQYIVLNANAVLFEHAGGRMDLRRDAPVEPATTMMAYSMSKTITAVAVLQLVEAGKVRLDEPVAPYVPSFPYGAGVAVRHLISHTSGIPNPIPLRWVHPAGRHPGFDERAALAGVLRAHPRLSFEPGTRYAYSNIGYWLLGQIVERASGQPFASFVRDHILQPLAVAPRELGYEVVDPARHATGYLETYSFMNLAKGFLIDPALVGDYSGWWLEIRPHYPNGAAFGGLVGTARAFGRLLQDQLRPRSVLFGDATRDLMYSRQRSTRGTEVPMTLGWHTGDLNGVGFLYKEGGGGGFHCMMRIYPTAGFGTVVMTNATGFNVRRFLNTTDPSFFR